jgi:hypothetical protein
MIFLLQYDRKKGRICEIKTFSTGERPQAQRERLDLELSFRKTGVPTEVVLLEAADEQTLKRTHQRYFKSPRELVQSMMLLDPT